MKPITLTLGLLAATQGLASAERTWKHVKSGEGITVTRKEVPGRDLPIFRGVAMIEAPVTDVLAVLYDVKRHTEWMHRCNGARLLRQWGKAGYEKAFLLYNRTKIPWPVADRDAVLYALVNVDWWRREVKVSFSGQKHPLRVKGVVRMPRLAGFYHFKQVGPKRTLAEYQVDADPGGWIPSWIVTMITRNLPYETLRKLRKQARRTHGWYYARVKLWKERIKRAGVQYSSARPDSP